MKVSYNWLKEFVEITAAPEEIASRLALAGTNIAGIENGPHGAVIDAEVTSNRPDCLGMLGIARELGAIYRLPVKSVAPKPAESAAAKASDAVSVKIEAPELCGRFTARVIRGVKIQPSPAWLKDRHRSRRHRQHQQCRRHFELRHARARPSPSHLRLRPGPQSLASLSAAPAKTKKSKLSTASTASSTPTSASFAMAMVPAPLALAELWAAPKPKSPSPRKMF